MIDPTNDDKDQFMTAEEWSKIPSALIQSVIPAHEAQPDYEVNFQFALTKMVLRHVDQMRYGSNDPAMTQIIVRDFLRDFEPLYDQYLAAKYPDLLQQG